MHDRCRHYLEALRQLLLGFDVDAGALERMAAGDDICGDPIDPHEQVAMEEEILSLFVDVISLFRRNPVDDRARFGGPPRHRGAPVQLPAPARGHGRRTARATSTSSSAPPSATSA